MTWFKRVDDDGVDRQGIGSDFQPDSLESSLHWQVIWPRVIAKAWSDPDFNDAVRADPGAAIKEHFGYVLSPNLLLQIEDAPANAVFEPEKINAPNDPWSKLPPLRLTVVIPPPPPANLQAVAITAYQDTGRTYPFTCC